MPRPERPIDESDGPTQRFAAELRKLRDASGSGSYRAMATRAHFSKATLSSAASGHRLPTWDVTRAYVEACGGDLEEWRDRWAEARTELGLPIDDQATEGTQDTTKRVAHDAMRSRPKRRTAVVAAAILILTAVVAGVAYWKNSNTALQPSSAPSSETTPRFAGTRTPIADNADPKETGCAYDTGVTTLDTVEINTAQRNYLGAAELRYSPQCQVAWGRFTPSDRITFMKSAVITISAERPKTGTNGVRYTADFDGQAVFGNILRTAEGCVRITVTVEAPSGGGSSTTNCHPGGDR